MSYRLFEGKDHASLYQKYRFAPPDEVKNIILQYLDEKKGQPHVLAVDLGCGTGQNTRLLAPHFQQVVGIDISESQLEVARAVPGHPNITYRNGTAEELPFPDGSVDLVTAATAAHWFDQSRFLAEASRVLKPRGCMALLSHTDCTRYHYLDCGERLRDIFEEVQQFLSPYMTSPITVGENKLEELYSAIPFPDKERIEGIQVSLSVSVRHLMGRAMTSSTFQIFKEKDPQKAEELLLNTEKRLLEEMGVTSPDTEIQMDKEYYCILASKPQ